MEESDVNVSSNLSFDEQDSRNCSSNCSSCPLEDKERKEMLMQIQEYDFAINELSLYLDTHPNDRNAIYLHKDYCRIAKDLKNQYQRMYGPLTIYYPCNKWRWIDEPWPWERGNF